MSDNERVIQLEAIAAAAARYVRTVREGMKALVQPDWKERFISPADQTAAAWVEMTQALEALKT